MRLFCWIKLGTMVHGLTEIITFGNAYYVAGVIAGWLGYKSCGCEKREQLLNNLTCGKRGYQTLGRL